MYCAVVDEAQYTKVVREVEGAAVAPMSAVAHKLGAGPELATKEQAIEAKARPDVLLRAVVAIRPRAPAPAGIPAVQQMVPLGPAQDLLVSHVEVAKEHDTSRRLAEAQDP